MVLGLFSTQQTSPGEDPALLLVKNPNADPQLKSLGKLANSMAAAQGGKLTPEQQDLLSKGANELLTATSGTLTNADKETILAFINQLGDYPTAEEPEQTTKDTAGTKDSTLRSATRSAQNSTNLLMDDFGLSLASKHRLMPKEIAESLRKKKQISYKKLQNSSLQAELMETI